MRLVHPMWDGVMKFEENKINVLVVEDGFRLSQLILELKAQIEGGEGSFVLSRNYEPIDISKNLELIVDVFTLDFNKKKLVNKLMEQLCGIAVGEEHYMETVALCQGLVAYGNALCENFENMVSFDEEFAVNSLFKALDFKISAEGLSLAEGILEYMVVTRTFLKEQCFVFVNLKSYLSEDELDVFYQEVFYGKHHILLIENIMREQVFPFEKIRIIDRDLCEILVND